MGDWTIFSNYGHVLVCLARNSQARLRDVARDVGVTERAVQTIVRDLQDAGYLTVTKQGRCNRYRINNRKSLRHGLLAHCTVGKLLALLTAQTDSVDTGIPDSGDAAPQTAGTKEPRAAPKATRPQLKKPRPQVQEPAPQPQDVDEAPQAAPPPEKKKEKRKVPVDTRRQGSLF